MAAALRAINDAGSQAWLLRTLERSPAAARIARFCEKELFALAQGNYLTARALARRLLFKGGIADVPLGPSSVTYCQERDARRSTKSRSQDSVSSDRSMVASAEGRLDAAAKVFPELEAGVQRALFVALDDEDRRERRQFQLRELTSPSNRREPDAFILLPEIVETSLQEVASEGRALRAQGGQIVPNAAEWEDHLADLILNDVSLPLAVEGVREPRPSVAFDPDSPSRGSRVLAPSRAPRASGGRHDGWVVIASAERRIDPGRWDRMTEIVTQSFHALELRTKRGSAGIESPPYGAGDARMWFNGLPLRRPVRRRLPNGPLVGIDFDGPLTIDASSGLGLGSLVLVPSPHLIDWARSRPAPGALLTHLDEQGDVFRMRVWRCNYTNGDYELARPLWSGSQLLVRPDVFQRLCDVGLKRLVWREFVHTDEVLSDE
jgi:hypothetical protein